MAQAQVGTLKSTVKLTRINGDDTKKAIYRNVGNNHAYPFVWANTVTMSLGETETLVASGIKWHGFDLATYANVTCTPLDNPGGYIWVDKDTTDNVIKVKCSSAAGADYNIDVKFMLGEDITVSGIYCASTNTGAQSLP